MDKANVNSVYSLINELCLKLISENSPGKQKISPDVRKLRTRAYEILLKKYKHNIDFKDFIDPLKELDIFCFAMKIKARNNCKTSKQFEKLEQILNEITRDDYFINDSGKSILIFLLFVKDSFLKCNQNENEFRQHLLVPGPFTLHLEYSRSLNYPFNETKHYLSKLEHFKGLSSILDCNNPYLPQIIFEKINNCPQGKSIKPFKFLTGAKYEKSVSYKYLKPFTSRFNTIENQQYSMVEYNKQKDEKIDSLNSKFSKRFGWNWENLGTANIQNENKFASELDTSMPLEILVDENLEANFKAKIINIDSFLSDVKSLLVGIESESFFLHENITFHMVNNLTIYNVVPMVIRNFVQECLECGTSYRRMQILCSRKNCQQNFDGFIFKALCNAIEDYLLMFRQFVFSYEDTKILEFYGRTEKVIRQMLGLAYILTIHPKVNENLKPPIGSQFLGYIYKEIMRVTQSDMLALLIFILKRCCHVYFKNLQKWIFLGHLEDRLNELFIGFVDQYHPNTKHFFDKAYFIKKEAVPGFFLGYEDYILQCGKYTMLLRAFNPNHPIFSLEYPPVAVCLSFEELRKVEESCEEYQREALKLCEPPISVQDIYNRNIEKKRTFFKLVLEKSQKNLENWNLEKAQMLNQDISRKKKCLEELSLQIEQRKLHQIQMKMENIILERELAKDQTNQLDQIYFIKQQEALKRIRYYEEMNTITEKQEKNSTDKVSTPNKIFDENKFHYEFKNCKSDGEHKNYQVIDLRQNVNDCDNTFDIVNCNEIVGGENFEIPEATTTKKDIENKNLTEAQRNKIKVLGSEYNIFGTAVDVNCNIGKKYGAKSSEISDLQKNRMKIMHSTTFQSNQSLSFNNEQRKCLDTNTERARNKKKILESEYYITTEPACVQKISSPMSTSSDSSLDLNFSADDIKSKEPVKVHIDDNSLEQNTVSKNDECPNLEQTSNTEENSEINDEIQHIEKCSEECMLSSDDLTKKSESKDNDETYKRSLELIINNFKCEPKTGLIRLKDIMNQFELNNRNTNIEDILKKQVDLNSLSVITLTEFLQKSVTLPLKAHLKIVNNEVMRVFLINLDLINHFNSLRNYFFLMDGEFSSIICDELINKLEEGASPTEIFNYQTLHSVLDKAIGSSYCSDKNSNRLSFIVSDVPEQFELASPSVLSNLCLSYKIDWPLNLILNPETLDKYGDIFRYLFKVRRISWVLEQSYRIMKESAKLIGKELLISPQYRRIQMIRHKLFHFVHALRNHITASALQASWKEFEDELLKAKCIEEIYRKHTTYIKKILFLCMLNKSSIDFYKAIENIFKITLRFYRNLKSKEWQKNVDERNYIHPRFEKLLIDEKEFEKLVKYVIYLGNKIVKRGYQEEIGEFLTLVNYNQYYLAINTKK